MKKHEMRREKDADESRTLKACPHCDNADLRYRNGKFSDTPKSTHDNWYCPECNSHFRDAVEREARGLFGGKPQHGLAAKVYDQVLAAEATEERDIDEWLDDVHEELTDAE